MKLKISYQPQFLDAPEAYAAVMELQVTDEGVLAALSVEYLGRDEISEKELQESGYTTDDDFNWQGKLHPDWNEEIQGLMQLPLTSNPDPEVYFHLSINEKPEGFPQEIQTADLLFQELLQAILETASIEAPLEIWVNLDRLKYHLEWRFSEHMIELKQDGKRLANINWITGRNILTEMYAGELEELQKVKPDINCFSPDQKKWYPLNDHAAHSIRKHYDAFR